MKQSAKRGFGRPARFGSAGAVVWFTAALLVGQSPKRNAIPMISFELKTEQPEFIPGEGMGLVVRILNKTAAPIQVPDPSDPAAAQPVYYLRGPGYAEGIKFSRASQSAASSGRDQAMPQPANLSIPANGEASVIVPLSDMLKLSQTGEYQLAAQWEWQGAKIPSGPLSFRVAPLQISSIHLGTGVSPMHVAEGTGAFLRRGGTGGMLYRFQYLENHPGISEAKVYPPTPPFPVGSGATDVAVPWTNGPFFRELVQWVVWREGRRVSAVASTGESVSLEAPVDLAYLVRPPLLSSGGPIDVLAVSADFRELLLVRFPARQQERSAPPTLAWRVPLPAKPSGITAVLAPAGPQARRHIAFTAMQGTSAELYHTSYPADGPPEPFVSVSLGAGQSIPGASPGLYVDPEGRTHAGAVVISPARDAAGKYRTALAEVVFPSGGRAAEAPRMTPLDAALAQPSDAAVFYHAPAGGSLQREILVRTAAGVLRYSGSPGLVPLTVPGNPTTPLLLAPGKGKAYLLYHDAPKGFHLEPL